MGARRERQDVVFFQAGMAAHLSDKGSYRQRHNILRHPEQLCYTIYMKPSEALAEHRAELRQLASRYGLSRPRVFGSVLNGTDTEESDLDLLVDPAESTSLLTLAGFKIEAEKLLGVTVSVLTPNGLPPKFRHNVLQQAQHL